MYEIEEFWQLPEILGIGESEMFLLHVWSYLPIRKFNYESNNV